jgi:hypothetical protein
VYQPEKDTDLCEKGEKGEKGKQRERRVENFKN